MKHKKILLLGLATLLSMINVVAQNITDIQEKGLNPVSPTVYQFLKFGDTPVNEYTGSPDIKIPLFQIDVRGFSLPVQLQYYPKGIRVSEESDWVGLGWDLSFGSIVQIVNDKDDLDAYYDEQRFMPYVNYYSPYTVWGPAAPDSSNMVIDTINTAFGGDKTYSFVTFVDQTNLTSYTGWEPNIDFNNLQLVDFERDLFIANVLGEKLYILVNRQSLNGHSTVNVSCKVLNKKGYSVSCFPKGSGYNWKIINPSGITCYYEQTDTCEKAYQTFSGSYDSTFSDNNTIFGSTPNQSITGLNDISKSRICQITKIISIYGDTIQFNYTSSHALASYNISQQWKVAQQVTQNADANGTLGPVTTPPAYMTNETVGTPMDYVNGSLTCYYENRHYLQFITYNHNTVSFVTSARTDWNNALKLDSIIVRNSSQQTVKHIAFNYSYFQSSYAGRGFNPMSVNGKTVTELTNRLRLDSIKNQDDIYSFSYNSTTLPPKNSYAVDYWGYYNGKINNHSLLPDTRDFDSTYYITNFGSVLAKDSVVKYADPTYCKAGVLETIQYPTGGFTKFRYSLNCFNNYQVPNNPKFQGSNLYYGDGLKIDSIINYTNNKIASIKQFKYMGGKLQIPLKQLSINNENYYWLRPQCPVCTTVNFVALSAYILSICSNSCYIPNPFGEGTGVGYDVVTSREINYQNSVANGKDVCYYTNNPDVVGSSAFGYLLNEVPTYHKGIDNGSLLREESYNSNNKMVSSTNFHYQISFPTPVDYNGRASFLGLWGFCNLLGGSQTFYCKYKKMLISYYPLFKPETLLTRKQKVDYFNNDSVVYNETYTYDPMYNLLYYKKMDSSIGNIKVETYLYPYDIRYNPYYSQNQRNAMTTLCNENRLNERIQTTYSTSGFPTMAQYIVYNDTVYLPEAIQTSYGGSSLQTDMTFNYNPLGYVIQATGRDHIPITYLWSYNNQYIIAKIKGLTYSQVSGQLTQPFIDNLAQTVPPTQSQINTIRSGLGNLNAMVTTYNYTPLIGMTSETNPQGVTTRYTYDTFGRLWLTRNDDKNLLARYRYAYQNTPDNGMGGYTALSTTGIKTNYSSYIVNTTGTATVGVTGGSGNYSYQWTLINTGTPFSISTQTSTVPSITFTCPSQAAEFVIQCTISDNVLGFTTSASTGVWVASSAYSWQTGFASSYGSISISGTTANMYFNFYPTTTTMQTGTAYLVANIMPQYCPSATRNVTYTINSRTWYVSIYPNGNMYITIQSGSSLPINSGVTLNLNYAL